MTQHSDLRKLIDEYWSLAYAEGKEGRTQDTEAGDAQRVCSAIDAHLRCQREELLELAALFETCVPFLPPRGQVNIARAVARLRATV